ncbi:MAG: hypothetical protein CL608_06985 [Anaerolineaceae bacterium]|nr:hypothetical protein [Anaerolineaceae bacterium]
MRSRRFRSLFGRTAYDFWGALAVSAVVYFVLSAKIEIDFVLAIFELGVQVLSIVFSVYFAALAVVITAGDDQFVGYLERLGVYQNLIWGFKVTLLLLFCALIVSIILYVSVLPFAGKQIKDAYFTNWGFSLYAFFTLWSLFGAAMATLTAISYAEYRVRFLNVNKGEDNGK